MRFIFIPRPPALPARWSSSHKAHATTLGAFITQGERSAYLKEHGCWVRLKKWLSSASGQKCWYCEAKSSRAPFDVDHFRPKLAVTVDGAELAGHDGYHWLAYEWWNFRLSCQRCNRPEKDGLELLRGKANEFPLKDEANRCQNPATPLSVELPRLLDPCMQSDCDLLAYGIDGEVKPAAPSGTWAFERADYTIKLLGLNAWNTPEARKNSWRLLDDLMRLVGNHPDVVTRLQEHLSTDHEYSSFFRSAIGTRRDQAWVEALL